MHEIPGLASRGFPLKTVIDAIVMGNTLIAHFEAATTEPDPRVRQRLLTVVVLGGGFSGVEVAGHIADLMHAVRRFYPELKDVRPRIVLLQKGERLVPEFHHDSLSDFTLEKLRENGIDVRLHTVATEVTSIAAHLASGERIETEMIVSTVGTATHPLIKDLGLPLERGRLKAEPDMRVKGAANLWALGDCSLVPNAFDGLPSPTTAQFAIQQARQLAKNLNRTLQGGATKPFSFVRAACSRRSAIATRWPLCTESRCPGSSPGGCGAVCTYGSSQRLAASSRWR
jgi:NADH dehydrogenase